MTPAPLRPSRFSGHVYGQVIPDPDEIRPGPPAPWAHLAESQRRGVTLELVRERLMARGRHFTVAPLPTHVPELRVVADAADRPVVADSAVLVALFEEGGETHVVVTRRAQHLRQHRGEIAFPGGRSDPGEDPIATALREAREEVGLERSVMHVEGWLQPLVTLASASSIWPIVATAAGRPALAANPDEVAVVYCVTLSDLAAEGNFVAERWRRRSTRPGADAEGFFPIYFFRTPEDIIWGATARILTELLCVALDVPWPDEGRFDPAPPE